MPIIVDETTLANISTDRVDVKKVYARQGVDGTYVLVFEKGGTVTVALYFGGNWKMNNLKADIDSYFESFNGYLTPNDAKQVIIFPPACYLDYVRSKISSSLSSMVKVGIQLINQNPKGAYTGQISAAMAADCGCSAVMIGQGECRQYLGVTDEQCNQQVLAAMGKGLDVWLHIGETLDVREAGNQNEYVTNQLEIAITGVTLEQVENHLIIVYEPLWAIGTGYFCSADDAEIMHKVIREKLASLYGDELASTVPITFAGSVKASNAQDLMSKPDINGVVAGGASLQPATFATIINMDY